jgi:putative ABC transport system permease protein
VDEPQRVFAQLVTGNYFDVLGVGPAAGRFFALLGVNASDPVSFAGSSPLIAAVALIGSYFPARRASRFDPLLALREP